jgi:hypothetical protein
MNTKVTPILDAYLDGEDRQWEVAVEDDGVVLTSDEHTIAMELLDFKALAESVL